MSVEAFQIQVSQELLADVDRRLANVRWPDELEDEPWRYGPPISYMQSFVRYWREEYDWEYSQAKLNELPNFRASLGDQQIHFVHQRGVGPAPIPIILTHGWPGSFVEMLRIIPLLSDPAAHGGSPEDAFDVIVPSMPGYGFSSRPTRRGMSVFAIADLWRELMSTLGYNRFGVQGGDWGSWVSVATALQHPQSVIGVHLNYLSTRFRPAVSADDPALSVDEEQYLANVKEWLDEEGGYIAVQATRPLSLSYGLTDSPIGLAAWFIEKFRSWSGCENEPDEVFSRDEMITDILIHWATNTVHSAMRLYAESREHPLHLKPGQRIEPPCGIARLPAEIPMPPRSWAERAFNVTHWTQLSRGGHFAAWEVPHLLAEDIRAFFRPLRSA